MPDSAGKRFKPTKYIPVCTAATLLVGSSTLFFVFTCPWLANVISPVVPLYNGVVFLFVLANFSMATFMDPGVFPRASEDEDKDDDFRAPLYKNVEVKGIQVRMKCMIVMCVSGLFFIPVMGLTGFHLVLVARGRTTNEQVTGKFRGGVNPFTRGCCGNVKHVLCSPLAPRYMADPRKKQNIQMNPPFLRPVLSDRNVVVKLSDNGVHANILRTKSKTSLDGLGEKSADIQPPLPPKAERHHHLHHHPHHPQHQVQNQLTSSEGKTAI
ncbi:hypothetical protein PGIGA_G00151620 [Pangasianodon gigas]|uniref:Uncharacterized protein n=1 Tax=Pangasianodon gigas TaxID=30993 RepID=A0ACC5XPS2_PANGG|nr:hypothetical protein [Pangasianodon gigas]